MQIALGQALPQIIGGQPSTGNEYRSMVTLGTKSESIYDGHFCGGTIIAASWVLTAAHCVRNKTAVEIRVVTGIDNLLNSPVETFDVAQIILHPMHTPPSYDYDFALIKLDGSSSQPRIGLYSGPTDFDGSNGTTIGWGSTVRLGENFPTQLQKLSLPIVSNNACGAIIFSLSSITENMLCAGDLSGVRDSCGGDSGSPMFVTINETQVQVGIVSFGFGSLCANNDSYSVWARVSAGIDFVAQHIANVLLLNEDNIPEPTSILEIIVPVISTLNKDKN